MTVTLITPTGWRPKAFALAEKYVARQTYKGDLQWIVVSDDPPERPTPCTMGQEYVQCPLIWKPGINTQRYNFAAAIPKIKGDYVLIWEDDDYYKPEYIDVMVGFLKHADLVGECDVTYYSFKTKGYMEMGNHRHASLCQTGFTKKYLPWFERAVHSGETYMDISIWNTARDKGHNRILFSGLDLCVGLKGIPGRGGIGVGHSSNDFLKDNNFIKLKQLIGPENAQVYIDMMGLK